MYRLRYATPFTHYMFEINNNPVNEIAHILSFSYEQGQFILREETGVDLSNNSELYRALQSLYSVRRITERQRFEGVEDALDYLNNLLLVI